MKKLLLGNWVARLAWLMMLSWPMVGLVCWDNSTPAMFKVNQGDFKINDTMEVRLYGGDPSTKKGEFRSVAIAFHNGTSDTFAFDSYPRIFDRNGGLYGGNFVDGFYTYGGSVSSKSTLLSVYVLGRGSRNYVFKDSIVDTALINGLMCFHQDSTGFLVNIFKNNGPIPVYFDTISFEHSEINLGNCPGGHGRILDRFQKDGVTYHICKDYALIKKGDTAVIRKDLDDNCYGNNYIYKRTVQ